MTPNRREMLERAWDAARAVLGVTLGAAEPDNRPWRVEVDESRARIVGQADDEIVWDGTPLDAADLAERLLGAALAILQGREYVEGGDA